MERLDADGDPLPAPRCTTFVYDQFDRLIAEHDCSSGSDPDAGDNVLAEYVYLAGYHVLAVRRDGDAWYWYLNDHLPTPKKLVDASRVVVWDGKMEPFGETDEVVAAVEQPLRFPGQVADPASTLLYNGDRFAQAALSRFTAPDQEHDAALTADPRSPLGVMRGLRARMMREATRTQAFAMADNNPLSYVDPTGRQVECVNELLCDTEEDYEIDWDWLWNAPGPLTVLAELLDRDLRVLACILSDLSTAFRDVRRLRQCLGSCPSGPYQAKCWLACGVAQFSERATKCIENVQ
ncbi:MAG: RHS domain-containing protein [Deltaproteobacteria bacterium]|nr:RHS domain-containing protein [Deltaproteobacteria bacterium]